MSNSVTIKKDFSGLRKLKDELLLLKQMKTDVGFFADKQYGSENDNLHVATVALLQETGSKYVPPRPFFSMAVQDCVNGPARESIEFNMGRAALSAYIDQPASKGLLRASEAVKNSIEHHIEAWGPGYPYPVNSPTTAKKKGHNKPLIDSGKMADSVDIRMSKGGGGQ